MKTKQNKEKQENSWFENSNAFAQKNIPIFYYCLHTINSVHTVDSRNSFQEKEKFEVPTVLKVLEVQSC